ncbi:hypothetical protein B0H13DRAFT_357958 [Mycena leptocephala]|nr:hypothetical protein B0H13DRAFT_357958 [Mycena leptocephala]
MPNPLSGSTRERPWTLDENGTLVLLGVNGARREVASAPLQRALLINEGPPSLIVPEVRVRRVQSAVFVHEPPSRVHADPAFVAPRASGGHANPTFAALRAEVHADAATDRERRRILTALQCYRQERLAGTGYSTFTAASARVRALQAKLKKVPLTHDTLYLDDACPPTDPDIDVKPYHECGICMGLLSHPVSAQCGHTFCFVCIRLWFERDWTCPECKTKILTEPHRHWNTEKALASEYPTLVHQSRVNFSWASLVFPTK